MAQNGSFSLCTAPKPNKKMQVSQGHEALPKDAWYEPGKGHFITFTYSWKLNLSCLVQGGEESSPHFSIPYTNNSTWELKLKCTRPPATGFSPALWTQQRLAPAHFDANSKIYFKLNLLNCRQDEANVKIDFALLNQNQNQDNSAKKVAEKCLDETQIKVGGSVDVMSSSVPSGQHVAMVTLTVRSPTGVPAVPRPHQDLPDLLQGEMVKFTVGDDEDKHVFYAYKNVLTAKSRVFETMFSTDMSEACHNHVTIQDMGVEVFKELLCFLYTGHAPRMYQLCHQLLQAADMYSLEDLRLQCVEVMDLSLCVDNAWEILVLADRYNVQSLSQSATHFIHTTGSDVIDTPGWHRFKVEHVSLLAKLFEDKMRLGVGGGGSAAGSKPETVGKPTTTRTTAASAATAADHNPDDDRDVVLWQPYPC